MSGRADSLDVEFVNSSSSTLRFSHRSGLISSQTRELKTLPPSGRFVFSFEKATHEFVEVKYKDEVESEYKRANVPRIDSDVLQDYSKITVLDIETGRSRAAASSKKRFTLEKVPRARSYDRGLLATVVMKPFDLICSGLQQAQVSEPAAQVSEPTAQASDTAACYDKV